MQALAVISYSLYGRVFGYSILWYCNCLAGVAPSVLLFRVFSVHSEAMELQHRALRHHRLP